jgi:hypothetical protein
VGQAACVIIINANVFGGHVAGAGDAAGTIVKNPEVLGKIISGSQLLTGAIKGTCEQIDAFHDILDFGAVETPGTLAHDICYTAQSGITRWTEIELAINAVPKGEVLPGETVERYIDDLVAYRRDFEDFITRLLKALKSVAGSP